MALRPPFDAHYTIDGLLRSMVLPAMGGLQEEAVSYDYTLQGHLKEIGGSTGYLLDATYTPTGLPQTLTLGTGGTGNKSSYINHTWEQGTDRLTETAVTTDTHAWMLQDLNYTYDPVGNVTSIKDPTTLGGQQAADTQCFAYDGHRRLTNAWTPANDDCGPARSEDTLGGRAPYWDSYTYNDAGLRTSETDHVTGEKDTYCYSGSQPHTLSGVSTSADCGNPERVPVAAAAGCAGRVVGHRRTDEGAQTYAEDHRRMVDLLATDLVHRRAARQRGDQPERHPHGVVFGGFLPREHGSECAVRRSRGGIAVPHRAQGFGRADGSAGVVTAG